MPELPDVETMRRYFEREALGHGIDRVEVHDRYVLHGLAPAALVAALEGRKFDTTGRRGKWLFARIAEGPWLVLHFGMTGSLAAMPSGAALPPYARVSFRFVDGSSLHFRDQRKLGRLGLAPDLHDFVAKKRLGPDALDAELTAAAFTGRLAARAGILKGVLLDQSFVAGIGNVYADEICFAARIGPMSRVERLSAEERGRLYRSMRSVLKTAVEREAGGRGFPKGWIIPERHAGGTCDGCGAIERVRFQGRYTYWCPTCQPTR